MTDIVKVDMSEYGLTEKKAQEVKQVFDAVLQTAEKLEEEYNEVVALDVSPEACASAKALRLKYVKVRTGIAAAHKEQKAFYLSGGRAVDGLKNAYTHAVQGNEEKLKAIETHYERIAAEQLAALQVSRVTALLPYVEDAAERNLSALQADEFEALLAMKSAEHADRIKAEEAAEAERVAKEKAEAAERERIAKENERLKAEAEAREKAEAAERAEREKVEAARVKREKAEHAKRDKAEAERVAAEDAERKRIETEREAERKEADAKLAAERAERERIESEAKAKADAERKQAAADKARAKDKEHRRAINNETAEALQAIGLTVEQSQAVVGAIVGGKVPNVTLAY